MNYYDAYGLVGRCLALDLGEENKQAIIEEFGKKSMDFGTFVKVADNHLVLQSIYPKLEKHKLLNYIPEELTGHLKNVFELNTERNRKILDQIKTINLWLSGEGVTPLYLKGAGNILDNLYDNPGERILHDIDFLVEEKDFQKTIDIFLKNDFHSKVVLNPEKFGRVKHYPLLFSEKFPAFVEIHRLPVGIRYTKAFTAEEVFKKKIKPLNNSDCFVMCDEHKIIHIFMHSQLEDKGHYYAKSSLRSLYDLLLLSKRVNIEKVFEDLGFYKSESADFVKIMNRSFGINEKKGGNIHLFRYELNLKSRVFSKVSSILLRNFIRFIQKPFTAISDKEVRILMWGRIISNRKGEEG